MAAIREARKNKKTSGDTAAIDGEVKKEQDAQDQEEKEETKTDAIKAKAEDAKEVTQTEQAEDDRVAKRAAKEQDYRVPLWKFLHFSFH